MEIVFINQAGQPMPEKRRLIRSIEHLKRLAEAGNYSGETGLQRLSSQPAAHDPGCPHCQKHIDAAIVARAMFSAGHWENTGRKKILRPCPKG
jgi:hypothetical protein